MRVRPTIQTLLVSCTFLIAMHGMLCHADDPAFVNKTFIGQNFFVAFSPNTTNWLSLEASTDLSNWANVASVATTNNVTIIHDPEARTFPQRFYRLRHPGFSVENAEAQWLSQVGGGYRFRLQHVMPIEEGPPYVFTATVIVTDGQKTIIDAQADGQPLEDVEIETFPSVEELFMLLRESQASGCWRVAVRYDPSRGYPKWCVVERLAEGLWKHVDQYRITEMTVLEDETDS